MPARSAMQRPKCLMEPSAHSHEDGASSLRERLPDSELGHTPGISYIIRVIFTEPSRAAAAAQWAHATSCERDAFVSQCGTARSDSVYANLI